MKSIALVIPCYNESKRILVDEFLDAISRYRNLSLLFVDDGSTDDTAEILALMERQSPSIGALYLQRNVGKAEAVRQGVKHLLAHGNHDAIGFWDADLATPLTELDGFIRVLDESPSCEAAIGARWPHLGARIHRNVFRNCTGIVMKLLIRLVLRAPVYDTQCGAKLFRHNLARRVFSRPFLSPWLFDVELLKRIPRRRLIKGVAEIPLRLWHDVDGSKLGFCASLRLLPDLLHIAVA